MDDPFQLYVIDTETTGLSAVNNDVIEISVIRLKFSEEGHESLQKTWLLKALNPSTIQDEALKINGHKREDILWQTQFGKDNYKDPKEVVIEIENWINEDNVSVLDRIFAGQNPYFDLQALQELWKRVDCFDTFPFSCENNNRLIDTKQLTVMIDLCTGKRRQYFNLNNLIKSFGVKKSGKLHSAETDTKLTAELLVRMLQPIKKTIRDNFSHCYPEEK